MGMLRLRICIVSFGSPCELTFRPHSASFWEVAARASHGGYNV